MKKTKLSDAIEAIGQAVFEFMEEKNSETLNAVGTLLEAIPGAYILVHWPESQEFMEEDWFEEEAIYALGPKDKTESSAFFVPIRRMLEG